jgi:HEAT repeat protein
MNARIARPSLQAWTLAILVLASGTRALASIEEPTLEEAIGWMKQAIVENNDPMRNRMYFRLRLIEQDHKGTVAPALLPLLDDPQDAVAEYAAYVLGWIEDPKAVDPLMKMLRSDKEGRVRHAARALGFMRALQAKDLLVGLLQSPNPRIRQDAAFALGQLEDRSVLPILEKFLETEKDEVVRHFAQEAITWVNRYAEK